MRAGAVRRDGRGRALRRRSARGRPSRRLRRAVCARSCGCVVRGATDLHRRQRSPGRVEPHRVEEYLAAVRLPVLHPSVQSMQTVARNRHRGLPRGQAGLEDSSWLPIAERCSSPKESCITASKTFRTTESPLSHRLVACAFSKIIINTAGVARVIEQVSKGEADAVAALLHERVEAATRERHQAPAASTAHPSESAPNLAAQLRELAELRDQGIPTPEEFDTQKARLLGG